MNCLSKTKFFSSFVLQEIITPQPCAALKYGAILHGESALNHIRLEAFCFSKIFKLSAQMCGRTQKKSRRWLNPPNIATLLNIFLVEEEKKIQPLN